MYIDACILSETTRLHHVRSLRVVVMEIHTHTKIVDPKGSHSDPHHESRTI